LLNFPHWYSLQALHEHIYINAPLDSGALSDSRFTQSYLQIETDSNHLISTVADRFQRQPSSRILDLLIASNLSPQIHEELARTTSANFSGQFEATLLACPSISRRSHVVDDQRRTTQKDWMGCLFGLSTTFMITDATNTSSCLDIHG
jgi:hypothetical protein